MAKGKNAKYGAEVVQRARYILLKAMDIIEDNTGKTIPQVVAEQHVDNPLKLIELLSKFTPRERSVEVSGHVHQTHEHISVSEIDSRITDLLGSGEDRDSEKALPH